MYADPTSTLCEQIEYTTQKARAWNGIMLGLTLASRAKRLSYRTEVFPRMAYALPAISLSKKDCNQTTKPALTSIKHGFGISKSLPNEMIFFPREYRGYGVIDLHVGKMAEQTKYIVQHLRNQDSLGRRVMISVETT